MTKRIPLRNRAKRAFTLIELMVVVLILAVLAALVVPRIVGRGEDAKRGAAQTDLNTIKSLLAQFNLDNGRYPTTEEGLSALRTAPPGLESTWKKISDREIANDPWGNPYQYQSENGTYTAMSYGSDGQEGGEGNAADIVVED